MRSLDTLIRSNHDLIKVAEIEPQSLWTKGTRTSSRPGGSPPVGSPMERSWLAALPQQRLIHGVGYPIGGTICDQKIHTGEFRLWTDELSSPWFSEHLSVFAVPATRGTRPCGFLMPPLQTEQGIELAAKNIRQRRKVIGKPFAFETGVNYFAPRPYEMPDGEFFAAVAEEADCGIILDLTNLYVNEKNGRPGIHSVLAKLPLERIWEVHIAGMEYAHGHWLDSHSGGIDPALAEIAAEVMASLPNVGAIVFEIAPDRVTDFGAQAFLREIETLNKLWSKTSPHSPRRVSDPTRTTPSEIPATARPLAWEHLIAQRLLPENERPRASRTSFVPTAADTRTFALYSYLAATFRTGAIAELLENTTRLLLIGLGEEGLRDLLDRYVAATCPVSFPTEEALAFRTFLQSNPVPIPGLDQMLTFEATMIEAAANSATLQITIEKDIDTMLADIREGRLPGPTSDRPPTLLEIGVIPTPFIRVVPDLQLVG